MALYRNVVALACLLLLGGQPAGAQDASLLIDLRGAWRFTIGHDPAWSRADYDDSDWGSIFVPAAWEDEGYPGYDGEAWYRKTFRLSSEHKGKSLQLHLGRIDDVDEVYVNGFFVGRSGRFPSKHETAYHHFRIYDIPAAFLDFTGENVIAVRVYDFELAGGMLEGRVGIYEVHDPVPLAVDLAGIWRFRLGDDPGWKGGPAREDWVDVTVPGWWESQGFEDYDGFAWYQKSFFLPARYQGQELVLLLGLIDDLDEAYVNGKLVGRTGQMTERGGRIEGDEWLELRAYPVPPGVLRPGSENTVEVRVFDGLIDGGIYKGPVGLMTRADFEARHDPDTGERFWQVWKKMFKE